MLYKDNDIDLLAKNIDTIIKEAEKIKTVKFKLALSVDEKEKIQKIILKFVKDNKRKIYGGVGLHMLMTAEHPEDVFYKGDEIRTADIDFYSPDPTSDIVQLVEELDSKEYNLVSGREGQHDETFTLFVDGGKYADISYVPRKIYNRIPYTEIDGYNIVSPSFMMIDYMRMFVDPMLSYWRFNGDNLKSFRRYCLLDKHYPVKEVNKPLDLIQPTPTLNEALKVVFDFLCNRDTCITTGFYAYNCFLKESGLLKTSKQYKLVPIPYYEIISMNYKEDALLLIEQLKKNVNLHDINYVEFYPFFQFTGFSVNIFVGDDLVAIIQTNNNKCFPYREVDAIDFNNKTETNKKIKIATFHTTLMFGLINVIINRTNKNNEMVNLYNIFNSHLVKMRKYYFEKTGKNFLDESLFKDFIVECIGETMTPERGRQERINARKKKGIKLTFEYRPHDEIFVWQFYNRSGNEIRNPKNMKLTDDTSSSEEEEHDESS